LLNAHLLISINQRAFFGIMSDVEMFPLTFFMRKIIASQTSSPNNFFAIYHPKNSMTVISAYLSIGWPGPIHLLAVQSVQITMSDCELRTRTTHFWVRNATFNYLGTFTIT